LISDFENEFLFYKISNMELDFMNIEGVKVINNIPYAIGADGIQRVFEAFGIKKSKKAAYKFITKAIWKKRIVENGKSKIAVPITEIQRWIKKNYPIVWQSSKEKSEDEKEIISKNFNLIESVEKIIDDIKEKIGVIDDNREGDTKEEIEIKEDKITQEDRIWATVGEKEKKEEIIEGLKMRNQKQDDRSQHNKNQVLSEIGDTIINLFLTTPPSHFKTEKLEEFKQKLIFVLDFIENINKLKKHNKKE
jgi:hypothetical protein